MMVELIIFVDTNRGSVLVLLCICCSDEQHNADTEFDGEFAELSSTDTDIDFNSVRITSEMF